jgi:hypothetical protein
MVSHHTHDSKNSVWPWDFDPNVSMARRNSTPKELPSLASFFIHSFIASKSMPFNQKSHNTDKQARLHPDTWGLPRFG